ncbi:LCP family protein [Dactylosporangium sp. AC04546]|uniref:LCP family protein n=1 Tax=Dactylosporangium sp. AC04546 TaxID=2862460 RepID=UPI002E7AB9A8|nr:LCP family protein [Dactylosporangium sp. AC04546]WVK89175.1 LCP family protein [Dactylosporangium sp. AC04546]
MTRKRRAQKDPLWARLALVFGAVLLVGSGGALVGGKVLLDHYSNQITHEGGLGGAAAEGATIDGPINLLLVGVDERTGNEEMGVRADSIIIAHVPASHDAVYLTSIPRDTRVQIPAHKSTKYDGGTDKINAAFWFGYQNGGGRDGGLELLAETVSKLAGGLKFNGGAIVNFDGFKGLVTALGGVHMCVDEKVTSVHTGWNSKTGAEGVPYYFNADGLPTGLKPNMQPKTYDVGCYDMAAWEALDYVRQRDKLANNDGDYGRQRHQQQFIKAMLSKATSAGVITNPIKVNAILNSVGKAVSFYNNDVSLADWIFTLKGIKPDQMLTLKVNNGRFNPQTVNGQSFEILDETAEGLLTAIAQDQVAAYVAGHPEMINNDAAQPAASPTKGG